MSDRIISLYRARLAREKGTIGKDWGGRISVALVYPNYYRVGMSNLGFQVLYALLNRIDQVVAERVFLPDDQEMSLYDETGKGILSLESQSPLQRFDLVAFSLSFQNDYPNVLKILGLGKIPLLSEERDRHHPFVMAGGITTFMNPEPLAPFFDFFLLGEAEANLDGFIALFADVCKRPAGRKEALKVLAVNIKSLYVPSFYHLEYGSDGTIRSMAPVENRIPERIEAPYQEASCLPVNMSAVLTPETEFADRVLIETARGCGHSCRFCAAGYVYRPPRLQDESSLLSSIDTAFGKSTRIGLLGASLSDIPGLDKVTGRILEKEGHFSLSSLRADSLTQELLGHLTAVGQKTLTIAPEAGSERLRRVLNKHLTGDQIIEAARLAARTGQLALRLYFMLGLPTESREDLEEIVDLVKSIRHHMIKESTSRGSMGKIKLSVNCFVPKPFTPFQWFPMADVSGLKEKQRWLKKTLSREGGVTVSFDVPKWAYLQSLLSVGDRRVASILLLSHRHEGDWSRAFRFTDLNPDFYVHRPKGLDEILPWDFIDHGIRKAYLIKEYELALRGEESEACRPGDCVRCGVCSA